MCYFGTLFSMTDEVVDTVAHHLNNPIFGQVDMVVGIGLSGTMPLVPLWQKRGINIAALRKPGAKSHGNDIEMAKWVTTCTYVIVDDFVDTGATLCGVHKCLSRICPRWTCAGSILYGGWCDHHTLSQLPSLGVGEEVIELNRLRHPPNGRFS